MSDTPTGVNLSIDDSIATLTLNIPAKHNSLSGEHIDQFCQHLQDVENNQNVRVLIVTGRGEKTFCAGAALDQLGSGTINGDHFADMTDQLAALSIPTICSFNGSAYGGGSEIGLACDFRIGIIDMRLFVPPARIGLCYPVNGIARFVQILGANIAKRLLIASEEFNGEQLLTAGYLTHLVTRETREETTLALAQRMAGYAPLALRAMKYISNQVIVGTFNAETAQATAQHCNASNDLKEGFLAMQEKRAPNFKGH